VPCSGNMAVVCLPEDTLYYTCLENQIKDDPDTKALMDTMRNVPLGLVLQEHVATVKAAKSKKMSKSQNHTSKKAESKSDVRTKSNEQSAKDTNGTRSVTLKDKANIENQIIDGLNGKQGVKPGLQTKTCHIEVAAVCIMLHSYLVCTLLLRQLLIQSSLPRLIIAKIHRQTHNLELVVNSTPYRKKVNINRERL
jgi:hypothetical protein